MTNTDRDRVLMGRLFTLNQSLRTVNPSGSVERDDPTLDEIYVQRFSEMICQAIDARFTFGVDINPAFGGSKVYDGPARDRKECMPKAIVVEEAVYVGT